MAEKILMTALSPTMEEGTIVAWKKKEGDNVDAGDVLCEVETDKATMDYEATQEGALLKILKPEGSSSRVGETIGIIGEEGEDIAGLLKEAEKEAESGGRGEEEKQSAGEAPSAPPAPETAQGTDRSAAAPEAAKTAGDAPQPGAVRGGGAARGASGIVKASPLARKLADMKGIDLQAVTGTGPDGRVVKRDVEEFSPAAAASAGAAPVAQAMQDETIPVSSRRAVIARRLAESKFSAPHYYLKSSVDMRQVISARELLNKSLPKKASFNAFLMKFAAEAIKRHPVVNSSWQGESIRQFGSIDIGLAVDAGAGLITPVVKNCGNRGVVDIDRELGELIEKARNNALKPEEYTGATFTISNLGSFGVEEFTAIINPPGSAILAVGQTKKTPVVDGDELEIVPVMKMTLSCDHRVIDGAAGARFLSELRDMMENPARVLF